MFESLRKTRLNKEWGTKIKDRWSDLNELTKRIDWDLNKVYPNCSEEIHSPEKLQSIPYFSIYKFSRPYNSNLQSRL